MGHCNALQVLQGFNKNSTLRSWAYGNKLLRKYPFQKCRFLRSIQEKEGISGTFTVRARTKEAKNLKISTKSRPDQSKSLVVSSPREEAYAPALSDTSLPTEDTSVQGAPEVEFKGLGVLAKLARKVLRPLSSLPLAIGELCFLAGLLAMGTFVEQGESPQFYFEKYPEDNPIYGFLTWRWVLGLCLDHIYSSPYFLGLCVLLAASLMACTTTTQLPMVKVARRWSFMKSVSAILKLEVADSLPRACIQDLGVLLMGAGYEVFLSGPALYGFKGLAGRLAPIGVHAALLLIMAGASVSSTGGYRGSVTVPQGLNFTMGDVLSPNGFMSRPTPDFPTEVHIDKFYIDYYDNGEVSQFHTDLSLRDINGKEILKKTISVNNPLRFGGITVYQTDWSLSALQVHKNGAGPFNLVMATLQGGDNKLFGTFLPVEDDNDSAHPKGISILARDLQSVVLYDHEGKFVGVRRPGSGLPISIDGVNIVVDDAIGSTGLELKMDPGVPVVYAGFGALMFTTIISFFSHSQVWALQDGTSIAVGGKSNRDKLGFKEELNRILDSVPEITSYKHLESKEFVNLENEDTSSTTQSTF